MEFEERFIRIRQERLVTPEDTQEIIEAVWRKWYGDATVDTDPYIWAYKPHFFMTDQYIYNYAYMVGYLISQGLRKEQEKRGDAFPAFYREFENSCAIRVVWRLMTSFVSIWGWIRLVPISGINA